MAEKERGICELYEDDPERADRQLFGREVEDDRRGFLRGAGLAAMGAAIGASIPFHRNMPGGLIPAALADSHNKFKIKGKNGLTVLNDRPVNAETPAHLLDDKVTPNSRHFVRNNGIVPEKAMNADASGWELTIDGEVNKKLTLTLNDLKTKFQNVTRKYQLECGGNGRSFFNPPARGNQWSLGAVGCAEWTGVRMADVFKAAGIKSSAIYTGYYGSDTHLSGKPGKVVISRGAPMAKMMDPNTILAFKMNGEDLPPWHGFPVRIVAPGWPGSVSGKWVKRIWVRDQVHDGPKMTGKAYRVPKYPIKPGQKIPKDAWGIIHAMPVKSIITNPMTNTVLPAGTREMVLRGHAWAGDRSVRELHVSNDFGATWVKADLESPENAYAWQHWKASVRFPTKGYYEIWARATDSRGDSQPFGIKWNAKGYLNNSMHRVAVVVPS